MEPVLVGISIDTMTSFAAPWVYVTGLSANLIVPMAWFSERYSCSVAAAWSSLFASKAVMAVDHP
jgi:hypothetical protein